MIWELVIGLVVMLGGGEALVRGAVTLARHFGVSPLLIGVTLIGLGTSAPELATCIDAAILGAPGLAVGNVVGSNIANVLLILAVGALLCPVTARPRALRRDGSVLLVSALICTVVVMSGHLDRWLGAILLMALIGYLIITTLDERRQGGLDIGDDTGRADGKGFFVVRNLMLAAIGLGGVLFGADLVVRAGIAIAETIGISDTVVGLTIVAIGTSLPELATAVIASIKGESELAFGNVVGSNIVNSLGILGATAVVQPIDIPPDVAGFDIWVMLAATMALLVFAVTNWRISRREGAALLLGYIAYLGVHASAVGA